MDEWRETTLRIIIGNMPELPEVETIRLQLIPILQDNTIESVEIRAPKSFHGNPKHVAGVKILGVERYGKMMLVRFEKEPHLAIHLKMTGQILLNNPSLPDTYTRVIFYFATGDRLFFNDIRRFGWIKVIDESSLIAVKKKLGPDPLSEMTYSYFKEILHLSHRPVKTLLMDQQKIAGVGNIYANDALYLSGIHPGNKASKITDEQSKLLFTNLQKVLKQGVKYKGASKTNFKDIYGEKGSAQEHFHVYDREGKICQNGCGSKIKRIVIGGRGTFFCPACQR